MTIDELYPTSFIVQDHTAKRMPIFRTWRLVAGTLTPGMVVEVEPVIAVFYGKSGQWRWRRKQGMNPRIYEVHSFGPYLGDKNRRNILIGRRVR